jgi:hypothetical protein
MSLGGVANRTGPPVWGGTCSDSLPGRPALSLCRDIGIWNSCEDAWISTGGLLSVTAAENVVLDFSLAGSAGKVVNGPSWVFRLAGGRPAWFQDVTVR